MGQNQERRRRQTLVGETLLLFVVVVLDNKLARKQRLSCLRSTACTSELSLSWIIGIDGLGYF